MKTLLLVPLISPPRPSLHPTLLLPRCPPHTHTHMSRSTFPGTEMPSIETYSPGSICPQLDGSCAKLGYWFQVRGTMCTEPEWKPQFANGKLSEASENAAYAAALDRGNKCDVNPMMSSGMSNGMFAPPGVPDQPPPSEFFLFLGVLALSGIVQPAGGCRGCALLLLLLSLCM